MVLLSLKWGVQLKKEYVNKVYYVNIGEMARNPQIDGSKGG